MNDTITKTAPVVQLTGVFRIVCSQPIVDSSVFQTYLQDAQLDVFGKVWCNVEYSLFAREFGEQMSEDTFQTVTYIVTVVSDIENVTVNEVDSRWKKFLGEVKSNVSFDKLDIRAKSILVERRE